MSTKLGHERRGRRSTLAHKISTSISNLFLKVVSSKLWEGEMRGELFFSRVLEKNKQGEECSVFARGRKGVGALGLSQQPTGRSDRGTS